MKIKTAALTLLAVINLLFLAVPVSAAWRVSPDIIDAQVRPGSNSLTSVSISNQSDQPADFKVELAGYGQRPDGSTDVLDQDSNPLSARPYIKFAPAEFHLNPGETQQIKVNVSIPAGNGGGRYAVLLAVTNSSAGNSGITSVTRLGIPIRLIISPSELTEKGSAKLLAVSGVEAGKPISVTTSYYNQGNVHYKVQSRLIITDARGDVIGKVLSQSGLVLPGYSRDLVASWIPENDLPTGIYNINASVVDEDGKLLSEAAGTLEVNTLYVPPPPLAGTNLNTDSAVTLKTDDGDISIDFPQGIVASATQVTLQNYPPEQLPFPPPGYQTTTTCFRVGGIKGLLTKDALISIKYSTSDLSEAGNDASRLRLAHWDATSEQWLLPKTAVDQAEMKLTVSSDQSGLWAVMAGSPPTSPMNRALVGVIAGGAVLVLIVILLTAYRRKGQFK